MAVSNSRRRRYAGAKLAATELRRRLRYFRRQLLAETDPIAYYSTLLDTALAQAQLDECRGQISEEERTQLRHRAA